MSSPDIQKQDPIAPADSPGLAEATPPASDRPPLFPEGTRLAPDLADRAEPCADGDAEAHRPTEAAALTGDNGGGTSGNHGNGTAG